MKLVQVIVECDNCGAEYFLNAYNVPKDVPKLHKVCVNCFLPMETCNPFYDNSQEASSGNSK